MNKFAVRKKEIYALLFSIILVIAAFFGSTFTSMAADGDTYTVNYVFDGDAPTCFLYTDAGEDYGEVTLPDSVEGLEDGATYEVDGLPAGLYFEYDEFGEAIGAYEFLGWQDPSQGKIDGANVTITGTWKYTEIPVSRLRTTIKVTSTPANGQYYRVGEQIKFDVTVRNTGNTDISNIAVYAMMQNVKGDAVDKNGDESPLISLKKGESIVIPFVYTVLKEDIGSRGVSNYALAIKDMVQDGAESQQIYIAQTDEPLPGSNPAPVNPGTTGQGTSGNGGVQSAATTVQPVPTAPSGSTPATDGGDGEVVPQPAPPEEVVPEESTPLAGPFADKHYWAICNLILTILTVLICIGLITWYFVKPYKREFGYDGAIVRRRTLSTVQILSCVPAVIAIIFFVLTEDMTVKGIFADKWTPIMVVVALIQIVILVAAIILNKKMDGDDEEIVHANEFV